MLPRCPDVLSGAMSLAVHSRCTGSGAADAIPMRVSALKLARQGACTGKSLQLCLVERRKFQR